MTAVPKTRSYITSVVVENDFIPRYIHVYLFDSTVVSVYRHYNIIFILYIYSILYYNIMNLHYTLID